MPFRTALACRLSPLILRLALAFVFLWAGWGKVFEKQEFTPAQLATLANMGVRAAQKAATNPSGASAAPATDDAGAPARIEDAAAPGAPLPDPTRKSAPRAAGAAVAIAALAAQDSGGETPKEGGAPIAADLAPAPLYDESRFTQPASLRGLYSLALMLRAASNLDNPGSGARALVPEAAAKGNRPVLLAWAASLTELLGGGLLLLGFFARFAALSVACVMVVAIWLTSVGPNLGASGALLGFLPAKSAFPAWQTFFLQLMCLATALGVLVSGAGMLSLDSFVFSSKPKKPAPAPAA